MQNTTDHKTGQQNAEAPLFSIVVPTFNRADSILSTIDGCLAQRCGDFELVIVDDGSTDNTRELIEHLDDPRVQYIHQQNAGPAAARNRGVDAASGRYIAYLDADDRWYPEYLEFAKNFLDRGEHNFVYSQIIVDRGVGRYWIKPDRGIQAQESIFDYLYIHGGFIQTSTMVVTASLAKQVRWDEQVTFGDNDQYTIDLVHAGATPVMMDLQGTLYEDVINPKALSQLPIHGGISEKHTNFFKWMAAQREHMSEEAWLGYRAKFETGTLSAGDRLSLLKQAKQAGVIGNKGMLRLWIQHTFPRFYRRLTDRFVALRGQSLQAIRP